MGGLTVEAASIVDDSVVVAEQLERDRRDPEGPGVQYRCEVAVGQVRARRLANVVGDPILRPLMAGRGVSLPETPTPNTASRTYPTWPPHSSDWEATTTRPGASMARSDGATTHPT